MSLRRSIPFPRATALLCALTATVATAQTKPHVAPVKDVTDTYAVRRAPVGPSR